MEPSSGPYNGEISVDNLLEDLTHQNITEQPSEVSDTAAETNENNTTEKTPPEKITQQEPLKCPECYFVTTDPDRLIRHVRRVHRGENAFQCYMCDYSTYNKTLFEEHERIHKGIKPFKCSFCPHQNVSKKNLKKHERIHRPDNPLKCPHCDFIARNRRVLECHAKKTHPEEIVQELKCNWCNKLFTHEQGLILHTTCIKTCDMPFNEQNREIKCGFTTCSVFKMRSHKETVHGVVQNKRRTFYWKCGLCAWRSNTRSKILLHLIHHPKQVVDEDLIDVSVLRKYGIM